MMNHRMRLTSCCMGLALMLAVPISANAAKDGAWRPHRTVELVVPASPNGSLDRMTRIIKRIWANKRLIPVATVVVNKPGGGHAVGAAYVNEGARIGRARLLFDGYTIVAKDLVARRPLNFTPIALLFHEFPVVSVPSSSDIRTGRQLIERLKENPRALTIGIAPAIGAANYVAIVSALQGGGVDVKKLKIVVFKSAPESAVALFGHHVDVICSPASVVLGERQAGRARILAVSAPKRLAGPLANVPTWKEEGSNSVVSNWRAVFGPEGMSARRIAYWDRLLSDALKSKAWQVQAKKNSWVTDYRGARATETFVRGQELSLRKLYITMGIIK